MTTPQETHSKYALALYPMRDICLVKGKGVTLWDDQGKAYLDCIAGHGVVNIGHCNEQVVQAIQEQASTLMTCPTSFYNVQRSKLLEKLIALAPDSLTKVFLCNSGTESVEAALKFARYSTGKTEIITAMRGFHGRTYGALSATFNPKNKNDFAPLLPGFHYSPYNNFEKLLTKVNEKTAAILLEIVQGEGGVHLGQKEFFQQIQQLCQEKGIFLIIDEVQTGFCRTGKMFASSHFDLKPDIICLAKAIAGGLPMGAVLCSDRVQMDFGKHGTTFGGNPIACAAALAAIDFMEKENLAQQAKEKGTYLLEKLKEIASPKIREVRGLGLMIGIELKEKSSPYLQKLLEQGILALPAGATVIRLLPPLIITKEELDKVIQAIQKVLLES